MTHVAVIAHGNLQADRLFDPAATRDNILERFYVLRETLQSADMVCRTADMFEPRVIDVLIFHDILHELGVILKTIKANPFVQLIYVPNEPVFVTPLHDERILPLLPVDVVLTWNDNIAGKFLHVIKCNIGQPVIKKAQIPSLPFSEKKFICSIFANKPSAAPGSLFGERIYAVDFFSRQPTGIDLYGIGWEISAFPFVHLAYRGQCENKKDVQQQYKFSIAYENVVNLPGLITEKIFDCFAAGTVPVYLGAPNIEDYIPASCFIDLRRFVDYAQLYKYLVSMSESEYQKYLDAAKVFIDGPQYRLFTSTNYVEILVEQVKALAARKTGARSIARMKWQLFRLIAGRLQVLRNWRRYKHFVTAMVFVW
ncbi:glycosyltransferase family 10 domain-containing protein [Thiovibrio frasassiensis]|uniref:Glycosyltransferase family 10 n=1 Tax=Thiovibrio frasassiensis TaxID=2984131 RepID=A0A9X4MG65_9BACT|nr:glycosyltransferase family 10 [Thiovibrio frasassiensis]MDG4476037.1 glycosyltransferase family 10 [Thiovibrio frasassiensis]